VLAGLDFDVIRAVYACRFGHGGLGEPCRLAQASQSLGEGSTPGRNGRLLRFCARHTPQRITVPDLLVITYTPVLLVMRMKGCCVATAAVESARRSHGAVLRSDLCRWEDLLAPRRSDRAAGDALELGEGWARRWTARWRFGGEPVICPVRDLASMPVHSAEPVRRFSWRTSQRHRPGLQYMVSTGRHHGFESHAEQQLLIALDFAGELTELLAQPFRLSFTTAGAAADHTPDFLAVTRHGTWLIDVRPGDRIADEDKVRFAAAAEAALSCGWCYAVVPGWQPNVQVTLDTLSSRRRPMADPLGLGQVLLDVAAIGPVPFGELVERTAVPAIARAHALHLIWTRQLGIELTAPLGDNTLIHPVIRPGMEASPVTGVVRSHQ